MKRNAKPIEETSKYKIVVENRFDNIPLTFKIWKNTNLKDLGYFPEWTILEEADPLNNIGLN